MKALLSLALALFMSATAVAQDSPAPGVSREKIIRFIEVLRVRQQLETMVAGMQQHGQKMAESVFRERLPDATPEDLEYMRSLMKDVLAETINIDEMLDDIIPVYQKHLTEAEIDATIAFYSTPAGRALLDKMPAMMQDAMQVSSARSEQRIRRMLDTVEKRTKEYLEKKKKKAAEAPATKT